MNPSSGTVTEVNRRTIGGIRRTSGAVVPLRRPNILPQDLTPRSRAEKSPDSSVSSASDTANEVPPRNNFDREEEENNDVEEEDVDEETEKLSRLRCASVRTEETQEKQKAEEEHRKNRCADYPGFAFGSPMFGSDTLMKFSIIKNELHNIMRSHLRRVDGEVVSLSRRIKALDEDLKKSEKYIKTATTALAEAVELDLRENHMENEDGLSQFDAQMSLLEGKLMEAKLLAQEVGSQQQGNISQ